MYIDFSLKFNFHLNATTKPNKKKTKRLCFFLSLSIEDSNQKRSKLKPPTSLKASLIAAPQVVNASSSDFLSSTSSQRRDVIISPSDDLNSVGCSLSSEFSSLASSVAPKTSPKPKRQFSLNIQNTSPRQIQNTLVTALSQESATSSNAIANNSAKNSSSKLAGVGSKMSAIPSFSSASSRLNSIQFSQQASTGGQSNKLAKTLSVGPVSSSLLAFSSNNANSSMLICIFCLPRVCHTINNIK